MQNRTTNGCIWESLGKFWEIKWELASSVVRCSVRKGGRDKLGKMILRSSHTFEDKPILPFSKSLEKIQIDFQWLSNDVALRWVQLYPDLLILNKYNDTFSEAQTTSLEVLVLYWHYYDMPCGKVDPVYIYLPYQVTNMPFEGSTCVLFLSLCSAPYPSSTQWITPSRCSKISVKWMHEWWMNGI